MQRRLLPNLVCLYGLALSLLFFGGLVVDYSALNNAYSHGTERAELRHRINVFADGTWFLLANLLVVSGMVLRRLPDR
ncbi:MAG: hypothetical protein NTW02_11180 [Cyanobium sp. LacPavin_0920_WC12_MAG_62_9]|nr:hypothetical protein [Cyanobium sp. LacPavin_0920_WC12_MAG_62_9]